MACQHQSVPFCFDQCLLFPIHICPSVCLCNLSEGALQQEESDEGQRASRREVMRLWNQLRQACLDREESREEVQRLEMDVALAAEELKMVKVQMSEKLLQLKDQMSQESAQFFENEKSHSALLQMVDEMERVVEMERRQAQTVQADCHALRSDGQATTQTLQEEKDRGHRLQEQCEQLKGQASQQHCIMGVEVSLDVFILYCTVWSHHLMC
uniref:Uncharacterized protein n=1 Tax=Hucho hucho TaxID=62062 RepID=A0A4W5NM22_9TELE